MSKLQVQQADRMNAEAASALDEEASAQLRAFATEDLREGAGAFVEKRPPRFVGR